MHLRDEPVALTEAPEFAMLGPWLGRAETVTVVTFGEHMRRRVATPDEIAACRAALGREVGATSLMLDVMLTDALTVERTKSRLTFPELFFFFLKSIYIPG